MERGKIPAFQLGCANGEMTVFEIINFDTGDIINVLDQMLPLGMTIEAYEEYDLVIYPGILSFQGVFEDGKYYWRMEKGGEEWFSDVFSMVEDVSGYMRIEYWHNRDFKYKNGHLEYHHPYKSFLYLDEVIGKPNYKKEKNVSKRDGKNFPIRQITWKEYNFDFHAPEYLCDAISLIDQHDNVVIIANEVEYKIDEFDVQVKWEDEGDLAQVRITFRTDTTVVVNSKSYRNLNYEVEGCGCVPKTISAVALIHESSHEFIGGYYTTSEGNVSLKTGDYVLVQEEFGARLYIFNRGELTLHTSIHQAKNVVCVNGEYYFQYGFFYIRPTIFTANNVGGDEYQISFACFSAQVEIWMKTVNGEEKITVATSNGSSQLVSVVAPDVTAFQIRPLTLVCSDFSNSNWFSVAQTGIGFMKIGTSFRVR